MEYKISRSRFLKNIATSGLGMGLFMRYPFQQNQSSFSIRNPDKKDFKIRGFHIDLRVEVMTMEALKNLAKLLSEMGINALIIEYEASYPYQKHATISNRYAYSRDNIKELVSYCVNLGIEVIPLQESLGHVQYILRHERYAELKVEQTILSQVDPLNEKAILFFRELIEDMASLHPSEYVHVGGDEVGHLNNPKFADYVKEHGISGLYTQYMKKICQIVIDLGKKPILWADMILKYPEAVEDLPIEQTVFLDWNYGWDINMFGHIKDLQKKGCTFWGAPALRSSPDNYYVTRWKKHFDNIKDYIPYCSKAGYEGVVMTSWSTSGVYTYQWEGDQKAVLGMFPIRNLYPLSGFRILVAAYAHSLNIKGDWDSEQFIINYAIERFGIPEKNAQGFLHFLVHEQVLITAEEMRNEQKVAFILESFTEINKELHQINANKNKDEFEHFKLMGDIRQFYLSVKKVDAMVESPGFDRSQIKLVSEKLPPLKKVSEELNKSFIFMNKGYLHDAELERLNQLRNKRLQNLCDIYRNEG